MQSEDFDQFEEDPHKAAQETFYQEEIRVSSNGSSPNLEQPKSNFPQSSKFDMFDKLIDSKAQGSIIIQSINPPSPPKQKDSSPQEPQAEEGEGAKVKQDHSIIGEVEKQWIIKQAERQRIGGTYDFFNLHLERYKKHILARKTVLSNIIGAIDKEKAMKAHPIMILKEYFKDYSSLSGDFHEKCYKFEMGNREESDNKMVNICVELRAGLEKLFHLRKKTGNQMSRLQKFMKGTTNNQLDKAIQVYWGVMASHQAKVNSKREHFQEKEKKFQKRIEKISKVYGRGRLGNQIDEDVFEEMAKFVKEERELRYSIYDWGKEILNLRKNVMNADYGLFTELQAVLAEFKNFNDTVYHLQKKRHNFTDRLKRNIESNYQFEKLVTPLDNDYIMGVLNSKNKSHLSLLKQEDYQQFVNEEYFGQIIGETTQFLKGTILKCFPLRHPEEELIKTVCGNLVHYNKKTLEIKYRMRITNTKGTFEGNGCVTLKEQIKGIIFDSQHTEKVYFRDDNRAEEIILFLSGQFDQPI